MLKCPGQDSRYWKPEDVTEVACSRCGYLVEFFKTEGSRRCPECGGRVVNPKVSLGCAQWCAYAKECLGFDPASVGEGRPEHDSVADRIVQAMKREFGEDERRIKHALRVLQTAEDIMRQEGGDPRTVIAAAALHDIGIPEAERRGQSSAAAQEAEGPPVARRILRELGFDAETVEHVCRIVGSHHSGRDIDTLEFRIIWDADHIVNQQREGDGQALESLEGLLRTEAGRELARRRLGGARGIG